MADMEMDEETKLAMEQFKDSLMGDQEMPSPAKFLEMLENSNMTDDMKEGLKAMLTGSSPQLFGNSGGGTSLGLIFILVIFSILLFFGYKLYKSIKDKELKREEKKKLKQLKKKK